MKAFIVSVNGKETCTAGLDDEGVVSVILTWSASDGSGDFHFHVGGLDTRAGEHVRWATPEVGPGDVVSLAIVEADVVDPPTERFPKTVAEGDGGPHAAHCSFCHKPPSRTGPLAQGPSHVFICGPCAVRAATMVERPREAGSTGD